MRKDWANAKLIVVIIVRIYVAINRTPRRDRTTSPYQRIIRELSMIRHGNLFKSTLCFLYLWGPPNIYQQTERVLSQFNTGDVLTSQSQGD